jgi:group II intron reverse transcriptase/maturase
MMSMGGGWVLEVDIRKFFDSVDRSHLREVLHRRVRDGVLLRLIGKWLNAGVLEDLVLSHPDRGTPQGGVISPLLANVFLHDVVDHWFATEVQPRLRGRSLLVRYADDMVFVFGREDDARRVMEVLPKRFGKYGLTLHPEKTRLLKFERPADDAGDDDPEDGGDAGGVRGGRPRTFSFLGFTHYWGRSRAGRWVIKRRTAKDRLSRALRRIWLWCRNNRHEPLRDQQQKLAAMMRGHYAYFGITANFEALKRFARQVERAWWTWLTRRSQHGRFSWAHMKVLLARFALPRPRIVHCYT